MPTPEQLRKEALALIKGHTISDFVPVAKAARASTPNPRRQHLVRVPFQHFDEASNLEIKGTKTYSFPNTNEGLKQAKACAKQHKGSELHIFKPRVDRRNKKHGGEGRPTLPDPRNKKQGARVGRKRAARLKK
jgi:hypothetical protein